MNSSDASILQSPEYCQFLKDQGYRIFSLIVYDDGQPVSYIMGRYIRKLNIIRTMGIGGLAGGCPIVVDGLENRPEIQEASINILNRELSGISLGMVNFYTPTYSGEGLWNSLYRNGYGLVKQKYTPIVDISTGKDELWKTIDRKNRNVIRYAIKNNVTVEVDNSNRAFNDFYELYRETSARKGFRPNQFGIMKCQFDVLSKNNLADIWLAKKDEEILAGAFIWKYRDMAYYAYGSSSISGGKLKASNLLNWELMTKYGAEGYKYYNMWEGSPDKNSPLYDVTAFKLSFGARLVPIPEFSRVNNKMVNFIFSMTPNSVCEGLSRRFISARP